MEKKKRKRGVFELRSSYATKKAVAREIETIRAVMYLLVTKSVSVFF